MGIPSVVVTRAGFSQVVGNAFAGLGFLPDAPTVFEFPLEMFLPAGDLTPLRENIDKIVLGLTKWKPKEGPVQAESPERVIVRDKDYPEAVRKMNYLFLQNLWSDGLPLWPPTEEQVKWILRGTPLDPSAIVGRIQPGGRTATVETLAVNLAMAGGRPEYLPVLIAAIEAIVDPAVMHQHFNSTTCSVFPALIVNGRVAKQIRLGCGYGCLGPNPEYPAGAAIGRAIRLVLLNVGGAIPGRGSMAIYGGANRYTNIVFAEDEEGLPESWEPLNTSYFGYPRGSNTVAVHPVAGTSNVNATSVDTLETAMTTLHTFASIMRVPNRNYWGWAVRFTGAPGIMIMARGTARGLARLGWSREKVQAFLWENSHVPWPVLSKVFPSDQLRILIEATKPYLSPDKAWPITAEPKNFMIAIAGGQQSGHGYWMPIGTSYKPVCKHMKLPPNWEELIKAAEKDLGPLTGVT